VPTTGDAAVYAGIEQGNYTANAVPNTAHSAARLAPTDAVYFMSAAEINFLKAEAYARLGNGLQAKASYDEAVSLSFARAGFATQAEAFLALTGKYFFNPLATPEQMVERIIMQKWVASARVQAWDAFLDQNRTGYPRVSSVATTAANYVPGQYTVSINSSLSGGLLPRRLLYPKVSSDYNTNAPDVVPISTKMWWHKQ
jgi:hypothetical protein